MAQQIRTLERHSRVANVHDRRLTTLRSFSLRLSRRRNGTRPLSSIRLTASALTSSGAVGGVSLGGLR